MASLYSEWKRKFSVSTYKNLKIRLGEMSFFKDFVHDTRGDLYPILEKSEDCLEGVEGNRYVLEGGRVSRLFCQFFPFGTYEVAFSSEEGSVGFRFRLPEAEAAVFARGDQLCFRSGEKEERFVLPEGMERGSLIVSCRPRAFDVYVRHNGKPEWIRTVYEDAFADSNRESTFENAYVVLFAEGHAVVREVQAYIDSGISLADIRPIRYENGDVILENGTVFFTASIRLAEGAMQGIFSWRPGTAEIGMTGALYFDRGDGKWRNYLASVILYHREWKKWLVWTSSFEDAHILAHGAMEGDPRFGVNVADVTLMAGAKEGDTFFDFVGFRGDEDPDLLYDGERWLFAVCRLDPETGAYRYAFFESDDPFGGFRYVGRGLPGAETGGAFVRTEKGLHFVCGNAFDRRSEYRIYDRDGMRTAMFNHPDGGFRGWGAPFSVKMGSRTRRFWLTFDRHNGSEYEWSYGNLYCFELERERKD